MQLIATRVYHDFNPKTGEEYELRDRMFRKACGFFRIDAAGELSGDPEVEQSLNREEMFDVAGRARASLSGHSHVWSNGQSSFVQSTSIE
jgi:hypothetical protein